MVCSNTSTDSSHRSLDIGSLLNPLVEGSSAVPIDHYASPAVRPIQPFEARYLAGHPPFPAPTCSWSNLKAKGWHERSSHSKSCEPYSENELSSPSDTFAQSWLPPDVTVAPFERDDRLSANDKYTEEESFYIWYHRVDLGLAWRRVLACFNIQFPDRQRSRIHSIQRALYRFMKRKDCPSFRRQDLVLNQEVQSERYFARKRERALRFGVIACKKNVRYPWMQENLQLLLSET